MGAIEGNRVAPPFLLATSRTDVLVVGQRSLVAGTEEENMSEHPFCSDCKSEIAAHDAIGRDCLVCQACRDKFFAEIYRGAQVDLLDDYGMEGRIAPPHSVLVVSVHGPTPDDRVVISGYPHQFREFTTRLASMVEDLATQAMEAANAASKRS